MFSPEKLEIAYGDYRESIGRPRVNNMENMKESIPYAHFLAGVEWCLKEMKAEGFLQPEIEEDEFDLGEDDAEDAL